MRERVFEAALDFVPKHGWSTRALALGAESAGLPGVAHGLFPDGAAGLITHFYLTCNAHLVEQMVEQRTAEAEGRVEKKGMSTFVRDSVEARLRMNIPYIDTWPQALAIMASPGNARRGWSNLCSLTDDIWHHAGDKATDMSWYTKRMSLAAVYKSTEVYMLQDDSDDFEHTWEFLNNRIKDAGTVGKTFSQIQNFGTNFGDNLWTVQQLAGIPYYAITSRPSRKCRECSQETLNKSGSSTSRPFVHGENSDRTRSSGESSSSLLASK